MYHKYKKYSRNYIIRCFVPTCHNNTANSPKKIFAVVIQALKRKWCNLVKAHYDPTRRTYVCEDHLNLGEDLDFFYYFKVLRVVPRLKRTAKLRYYVSTTQAINVFRDAEEEYVVPNKYSPVAPTKSEPTPSTSTDYQRWEHQPEAGMSQQPTYNPMNPSDDQDQSLEMEGEESYYDLQPPQIEEQEPEPVVEVSDQHTYLVLQPPANTNEHSKSIAKLQQQIIVLQQQELALQPQMIMGVPQVHPGEAQEYYELQAEPSADQQQLMVQLHPYLDIHTGLPQDQNMIKMQTPADLVVQSQSVLDSELELLEPQQQEPTPEAIAAQQAELFDAMKQQIVLEIQPQMGTEYIMHQPTHVAAEFKSHISLEQRAQEFISAPPPVLLEVQAARELKTVGVNTDVPYPDLTTLQAWAESQVPQADVSTQYDSDDPLSEESDEADD